MWVRLEFFFICQHSASWIQIWWVLSLCILCFFFKLRWWIFSYDIWLLKLICVCIVFIMFHVSHKTTILFYSSSQCLCLQLHIDNLIISIFLFLQLSWSIFFYWILFVSWLACYNSKIRHRLPSNLLLLDVVSGFWLPACIYLYLHRSEVTANQSTAGTTVLEGVLAVLFFIYLIISLSC